LKPLEKKASSLLVKAEQDAGDIIQKASDDASAKAEKMMKKATGEAQTEAEKIIQQGVEDSRAVQSSGEGKISAAVKVIMSQVTGEA